MAKSHLKIKAIDEIKVKRTKSEASMRFNRASKIRYSFYEFGKNARFYVILVWL